MDKSQAQVTRHADARSCRDEGYPVRPMNEKSREVKIAEHLYRFLATVRKTWADYDTLGRRTMTAAIFALAGTLLGILGTLTTELVRTRTANIRARQEALRLACADFTASVARIWNLSIELKRKTGDAELAESMHEAHRDARVHYERLRLTAVSRDTQESGRRVLRYAYGLLRQAEGMPPRDDERVRGPLIMLHDSLITLYAQVRRELGMPHADEVYREPEDWVGSSGLGSTADTAPPS